MKKNKALITAVAVGIGVFLLEWILLGLIAQLALIYGGVAAIVAWFVIWFVFKARGNCAICGDEVGLNRFLIGKTLDGKKVWKCTKCAKKVGYVEFDKATGKARLKTEQETEVRVKCNVCGHIYCYTAADVERNRQNYNNAKLSSISAIANVVGGTMIGARLDSDSAERSADKIVDYSRCPKCNSTDIRVLGKEEYAKEQKAISAETSFVSSADEIKKFKELLDMGVISQEEFDAKKKQLLGL